MKNKKSNKEMEKSPQMIDETQKKTVETGGNKAKQKK